MPDIPTGITAVATSLVSGGSAVLISAIRFSRRLKLIEVRLRALQKSYDDLSAVMAALKAGWHLELEGFKNDVNHRIEASERQTIRDGVSPEAVKELQRRLRQVDEALQLLRDTDSGLVRHSEFMAFVKEQQEQWRQIERTLGQIEGTLRPMPPAR